MWLLVNLVKVPKEELYKDSVRKSQPRTKACLRPVTRARLKVFFFERGLVLGSVKSIGCVEGLEPSTFRPTTYCSTN